MKPLNVYTSYFRLKPRPLPEVDSSPHGTSFRSSKRGFLCYPTRPTPSPDLTFVRFLPPSPPEEFSSLESLNFFPGPYSYDFLYRSGLRLHFSSIHTTLVFCGPRTPPFKCCFLFPVYFHSSWTPRGARIYDYFPKQMLTKKHKFSY